MYAGSMNHLPAMMQLASEDLQRSLQQVRAAVDHKLSSGQSLEEAVRVFLRKHLHAGLAVTQGQIVDISGNVTKQLDVIVYDAQATPILFTSAEAGHQLVPVEGVVGVVEVKSTISASTVPGVIANMQSVKSLEKRAYHRPIVPDPITSTYRLYGQELENFPIIYSLLAFESSSWENLIPAMLAYNDTLAPARRVDHTCLLDKGVIANRTPEGQFDAIPNDQTRSMGLPTEHALLMWYIFIQRLYSQATSKPINMHAYLGDSFRF